MWILPQFRWVTCSTKVFAGAMGICIFQLKVNWDDDDIRYYSMNIISTLACRCCRGRSFSSILAASNASSQSET